jgi:hypothetical protein
MAAPEFSSDRDRALALTPVSRETVVRLGRSSQGCVPQMTMFETAARVAAVWLM